MEQPKIMTAIEKLVLAGQQARFTVEQMIQMPQTGATVETLLSLIVCRSCSPPASQSSSRWIR